MSKELSSRIRRLEVIEGGGERVIVIEWPGDDVDAALAAKGVTARETDLVVVIRKDLTNERDGWVSVNGKLVA